MSTVLVTGASGYIGGRLVPRLLEDGHAVRVLVRSPEKLPDRWVDDVEVCQGDVGDPDVVTEAVAGTDAAYYLVHSMTADDDFAERDRRLAEGFRDGCAVAGTGRIVYLGGLGDPGDTELSEHLRSRHEVADVLRKGPVPVTELRAAVVIGSGSASFEMLRALVEVLPVMLVPSWVDRTRCQPIAVHDILGELTAALDHTPGEDRVVEVGGPDVVTYREMMEVYADEVGLRRVVVGVPVLSPRLSSQWIGIVTPLPVGLARALVDSLTTDVVVTRPRPPDAPRLDPPIPFRLAIRRAVADVEDLTVLPGVAESDPDGEATPRPWDPDWAGGTVWGLTHSVDAPGVSPAAMYAAAARLAHDRGRFGWGGPWALRGAVDRLFRGSERRWEVAAAERGRLIRVRAGVRLPGDEWLEWRVEEADGGARLVQTSRFVPRGLSGRAYWLASWPARWAGSVWLVRRVVDSARSGRRNAPGVDGEATRV